MPTSPLADQQSSPLAPLRAAHAKELSRAVLEAVARERQRAVEGLERQRLVFELAFAEQVRDVEAARFEAEAMGADGVPSLRGVLAAAERRYISAIEVERLLARAEADAAARSEAERWERRLAEALGGGGDDDDDGLASAAAAAAPGDELFALQQEHVRAAEAIDLAQAAVAAARAEAQPLRAERDAAVAECARLAKELERARGALVRLSFDAAATATDGADESERAAAALRRAHETVEALRRTNGELTTEIAAQQTTDANFTAALARAAAQSREIARLRTAAKSAHALNSALKRQVNELGAEAAAATEQIVELEAELEEMEDACLLVRQRNGAGSIDPVRFESLRRLRGRTASILQHSAAVSAKIPTLATEINESEAAAVAAKKAARAAAKKAEEAEARDPPLLAAKEAAAQPLPPIALDDASEPSVAAAPPAAPAAPAPASAPARKSGAGPQVHVSRHGSVSISLGGRSSTSLDRSMRELVAASASGDLNLRISPSSKRVEPQRGGAAAMVKGGGGRHYWRRLGALVANNAALAAAERELETDMIELKRALQAAAAATAAAAASTTTPRHARAPRSAAQDEALQRAFVAVRLRKSDFVAAKRYASGSRALYETARTRGEMQALLESLFRAVGEAGASSGDASRAAAECCSACFAEPSTRVALRVVAQRYGAA